MKKKETKYDVNKEIGRCGVYIPLSFSKGGKTLKYDYDREAYCEILKAVDKNIYSAKDRAEFLVSYAQEVLGLLEDEHYYDEEIDSKDEKERLRKKVDRIHNRILSGKDPKTSAVASDKTSFEFLEEVQKYSKRTLLIPINNEEQFYYENKYIYLLVVQLIEVMYGSEIFNYVPNSDNFQFRCYRNHLDMIYDNIKEIFNNESEIYFKWKEILNPFYELIYNCNYPGIKKDDIWHRKCEELRFFDCSYEIAKNYDLYCTMKNRLKFDLGNTQEEVRGELKKYYEFYRNKNEKLCSVI